MARTRRMASISLWKMALRLRSLSSVARNSSSSRAPIVTLLRLAFMIPCPDLSSSNCSHAGSRAGHVAGRVCQAQPRLSHAVEGHYFADTAVLDRGARHAPDHAARLILRDG